MKQVIPNTKKLRELIDTSDYYNVVDYDNLTVQRVKGENIVGQGNILGVTDYNYIERTSLKEGWYRTDDNFISVDIKSNEIFVVFNSKEKLFFRVKLANDYLTILNYIIMPKLAQKDNFAVNYMYKDGKHGFQMGLMVDTMRVKFDLDLKSALASIVVFNASNIKTYTVSLWDAKDYLMRSNMTWIKQV